MGSKNTVTSGNHALLGPSDQGSQNQKAVLYAATCHFVRGIFQAKVGQLVLGLFNKYTNDILSVFILEGSCGGLF